jgi:Sensors of blue-light using FAD
MLVRCLYASRTVGPLTPDVMDSILEQSRRNNPRLGITGMLCVSGDVFIQVLEGGRDAICELYKSIVGDPRHTNVRMLVFEEVTERRFGNWTMGHVNIAKVNASLLLKYSETAALDPFGCSGRATMALLDELVATASIVNR